MLRTEPAAPARHAQRPEPVKFVLDDGVARDFGQGALHQTGAPLDLAIEGQGFFKVQTAGRRALHPRRPLHASTPRASWSPRAAQPVLDDGGGEIVIDPEKGQVTIAQDGTDQPGRRAASARSASSRFDNLAALEKNGDNLYRNTSNLPARAGHRRQGAPGHAGELQRQADPGDHPHDRGQPGLRTASPR